MLLRGGGFHKKVTTVCSCFPPCMLMLVETVVSEDNTEKVEEGRSDLFCMAWQVYILWCCKAISSANMLNYSPSAVPEAGLLEHLNEEAHSWLNSFAFSPLHYPDHPSKTKNLNFLSCRLQATWSKPGAKGLLTILQLHSNTSRLKGTWIYGMHLRTLELPVNYQVVCFWFVSFCSLSFRGSSAPWSDLCVCSYHRTMNVCR